MWPKRTNRLNGSVWFVPATNKRLDSTETETELVCGRKSGLRSGFLRFRARGRLRLNDVGNKTKLRHCAEQMSLSLSLSHPNDCHWQWELLRVGLRHLRALCFWSVGSPTRAQTSTNFWLRVLAQSVSRKRTKLHTHKTYGPIHFIVPLTLASTFDFTTRPTRPKDSLKIDR